MDTRELPNNYNKVGKYEAQWLIASEKSPEQSTTTPQ